MPSEPNELLADLVHHPAWQELRKLAEQRMEREGRRLATEFLTANKQPDYSELQYRRGFFAGIKFLLDRPTLEDRAVQEALAKQRREDVA